MSLLETVQIAPNVKKFDDRTKKPVLTTWLGSEMIRHHSLLRIVDDIINMHNQLDVVKIGIIGEESTGKTTLAETLAHLIHQRDKTPFSVRTLGENEFLKFDDYLATLEPANYIFICDDLSFMTDKKAIERLKNRITKIRHLPGGQDVKVFLIRNFHYSLGMDKYLRASNITFFTSTSTSEKDNLIKLFGTEYTSFVDDFALKYGEMIRKGTCTFEIKKNKYFIYRRKQPFVNCVVFYDGHPRWTLFPKRQWLKPLCTTCEIAKNQFIASTVDIPKYAEEQELKWGKATFQAVVKLKLLLNGINVYKSKMKACMKHYDLACETKIITPESMAAHYGFETKAFRLRKKLDGVLAT